MVDYRVGDRSFFNKYLALHHAWRTGGEVRFQCFDDLYDTFDWTTPPSSDIEALYDAHVNLLRDQYQRLVLLWSGGTDSHTIYNVFARNRIHLDEIIVKTSEYLPIFPPAHAVWLHNNHWDPHTRITVYDENDLSLRAIDIPDSDWVWADKGDLLKYGMTSSANGVRFLCEKNHAGHHWCAIGGYEKPRLVYRKGRWFSRQLDLTLGPTMGQDYIHHFFLTSAIAIKQAHMLKQHVKSMIAQQKLPLWDGDWAESKCPRTNLGYSEWSRACGRHNELTLGVSHLQKTVNQDLEKMRLNFLDWQILDKTVDGKLAHDLATGIDVAKNFIGGLHELHSQTQFRKWALDQGWIEDEACWTKTRFVWSKEYDLGE